MMGHHSNIAPKSTARFLIRMSTFFPGIARLPRAPQAARSMENDQKQLTIKNKPRFKSQTSCQTTAFEPTHAVWVAQININRFRIEIN